MCNVRPLSKFCWFGFALCLGTALCFIIGLYDVAFATQYVSLLPDAHFDRILENEQISPWKLNGSGAIDVKETYEHNASARLDGPNNYASEWVYRLPVPLVPEREYVVSAWVKSAADQTLASLGVRWPGGGTRIYRGLNGNDGWQKMELEFSVPASAPEWIQIVLTGEHRESLWWNNVQLIEAKTVRERLAAEWAPRLAAGHPVYTGLVVNAKGLGVERGTSPKIYDEKGRVIYTGLGMTEQQLIARGVVAYTRDIEDALSHERLRIDPDYPLRYPLVIDAINGADVPRTSVVIREHDADLLYEALQEYDFLGRFAVVFVVDSPF